VRTFAGTADKTLIAGFVVADGSRNILIRGIGPTLGAFGVGGALIDPVLELNGGAAVVRNDNWETGSAGAAAFSAVGAFALGTGARDSALLESISGGRTARLEGVSGGTGVALVELYASAGGTGRLVNVSARTEVGVGDNILIAGFNVSGTSPRRLLIRAVGPTLGVFGVSGVLADPVLVVRAGDGVEVAANDNWSSANNSAELAAAAAKVGAFALTAGSKDAVIAATLSPGSYTAAISGAGNTTGVALVEVYELP
jgi:hypothetical protein